MEGGQARYVVRIRIDIHFLSCATSDEFFRSLLVGLSCGETEMMQQP